jgi:hypothetical protein
MYMGRVNGINLYKHGITRTYLNLDDEGNCYIGTGSGCSLVDFEFELKKLEETLKRSTCNTGNTLRRRFHRTKARGAKAAWCFVADTPNRTSRDESPLT